LDHVPFYLCASGTRITERVAVWNQADPDQDQEEEEEQETKD
jgi:hypothetical protein